MIHIICYNTINTDKRGEINMIRKRILLGVTGGIASYKAIDLTSKLTQANYDVKVILTEGARQFVTPLAFQAISRNHVYVDTFDEINPQEIQHVELAKWADIYLIVPATANTIAKMANGIADNMLTSTYLAAPKTTKIIVAPAMNENMLLQAATQRNLQQLQQDGVTILSPGNGFLACGIVGKGRLLEVSEIMTYLTTLNEPQVLLGKNILITAGPTQEKIDAFRFISNPSSGKMGYALAEMAQRLGAQVILISGPTHLPPVEGVTMIQVITAQQMFDEVIKYADDMDIIIKAAAVSDYQAKHPVDYKIKKSEGDDVIVFERTTDILRYLGEHKTKQFLVGFAAETSNIIDYAREKLVNKHLDMIVANDVSNSSQGFKSDKNAVTLITSTNQQVLPLQDKHTIAREILLAIVKQLEGDDKQ